MDTVTREQAIKALDEVYGRGEWSGEDYLPDLLVKRGVAAISLDADEQEKLSAALRRAK